MKKVSLHIFSQGFTQVIEGDSVFKSKNSELTKLNDLINSVKLLKPEDVEDKEYYIINILDSSRYLYISKEKKGTFHGNSSDLDKSKIDALIAEVKSFS